MIAAAVTGHRRGRGWLAWHVAALMRHDPRQFPQLEDLTGDAPRDRPAQEPHVMLHNLRLLKAAFKARRQAAGE